MQDRMNRMNRLFGESHSPERAEEALTCGSEGLVKEKGRFSSPPICPPVIKSREQ